MNILGALAIFLACSLVALHPVQSYAQTEALASQVGVYQLGHDGRNFLIPYFVSNGELERIELRGESLEITLNTRQERGFAEFSIPYEVFKLFWSRIAGSEDDLEGLVVVVDNNFVAHDLTFMGARNTISIELPPGSRIVEIKSVILPSKRPEMTLASSSLWVSPGDSLRVNGAVSNIDRISDISITVKVQ
ncbi:MAG: hypothetical protein ACREBU_26830, partial [Nitrososphaera sp.]